MTLKRLFTAACVWLSAVGATTCGGDASDDDSLCVPGENIFCRCRGGAAGTKLCLADGNGFAACESLSGACDEQPGGGVGGGSGEISGAGGSAPPPAPGELLAVCSSVTDCKSGSCPMGFCTKSCESYQDCAPAEPAAPGDCINFDGEALCVPYCVQQSDCSDFGESTSCGFTNDSNPPYPVVVCAAWGDNIDLPPDGYPPEGFECVSDLVCNLGLTGVERICTEGDCGDGCHSASDCPDQVMCSSTGEEPGTCGGSSPPGGDDCPGEAVAIAIAGNGITLTGDTSMLEGSGELVGTGICFDATAEDYVYAVTPSDTGTLIGLLTPSANFDSQIYVREAPCSTGTQVVCEDEIGDGVGELFELDVEAGVTIYIIVDGYNGSSGSYELELDM